jgi:hypothetical protein
MQHEQAAGSPRSLDIGNPSEGLPQSLNPCSTV